MIGNVKHIAVIQSLTDGERTGHTLYNDVIKRRIDLMQRESIKMTHAFFNTPTKEALIDTLRYINANASYVPGGILIHLEMHGNMDGLGLTDSSHITWKELVELLRPINIGTCNKLFLTMATCYGRYLYLGVVPYKKSPYSGFISASERVVEGEIEIKFSLLFESLIEYGNIVYAYTELEKSESNFYYKDSERVFEEAFLQIQERCLTDEEFRNSIIGDEATKQLLSSAEISPEARDKILKMALSDLYKKQKKAFDFSDCN
jgi:hypothetical protein